VSKLPAGYVFEVSPCKTIIITIMNKQMFVSYYGILNERVEKNCNFLNCVPIPLYWISHVENCSTCYFCGIIKFEFLSKLIRKCIQFFARFNYYYNKFSKLKSTKCISITKITITLQCTHKSCDKK